MKHLLPLLMAGLLGACSILPQSEPLDIYLLPGSTLPAQQQRVDWSLRVSSPSSGQLLDGTRIVVLPEPGRVNTYQGARWSERTPQLLRGRLLDAFHDDGRIQALSNDEQRLQADLGDKNFMILPNHGLLTAFGSIADAFLGMFTLQRACEIQVMAQGAGTELIHIPQQILDGARAMIAGVMKTQQGMGGALPWPALLRKLDQQMPGYDQ